VVNINQNGSYTLGSNMTGSLSLNHIGTGTTALTGMNTYAGTTLVKSGTLEVATGGSINNTWDIFVGLLSGDNGTLTINGTGSVTNSDGYIGHGSGSNGTVSVSGGTWTNRFLLIGNEGTGSLTINGTGNVTNSDGYIGNLPGGNGTVSVSGGTWTNSSNLAVGVSGTGSLTINGTGTVIVGATLSRGSNGTINLESGGTLQIGTGVTAGALDTDLVNNGALIFNRSDEYTYNGTISGTGNLTKQGAGTLTLAANNTYSDVTTITGGTLALSSTGQISHSGSDFYAGFGSGDNATLTINGGSLSNGRGFIGYGNGSTGTVNINSGTWTNALNLRVGYYGNGTLNLAGGSISNVNGLIGKYGASTGVANVSGGTWTSSGYMTIGDEATGTLNLTGGNVVVGGGTGNVTIGLETISSGTLNLGTGSSVGSLQAAQVRGGNGTAIVNFNHTGNYSFAPILAGILTVNKLGSGTTTLSGNNTYAGGTSIQNGTLSVRAPMALGAGNVSLSTGSLLVASGQEMSGSLQIGGNFDWTGGTIAYYDTGASPGSSDMQIVVGGNFTASAGNKTFDFSQVDALNSGNYTLVLAGNVTVNLADLIATHGPETTLNGTFSTNGTTIVYTVTGATSGGNVIQNVGGPNTPLVADYAITTSTITVGSTNTIRSLSFSNSAALTINATGQLTITSGNLTVQSGGTSVVSGGTLITSGSLAKQGAGELDLQSNTVVNGVATVVEGLLSVNAQLNANSVVVDPTATLGGAGVIVAQNVVVNGNLSPGNSPGTLNVVGNLVLTGANSTIIEIASPTNFDRILVSGTATLGGTLNAVGYEGYTIAPGSRFDFLQAGSIVGAYDSITAPEGLRARFLNSGTVGTLLFGPGSYVMMAINQNQRNVAEALDTYILATEGDPLTVSVALDSLTTEQFPAAFDQIMPGFYESLANIAIEQTYNQAQLLTQRLGSVRLGATGFQAIGMSQPIKYDKDGKSAADAKTASPIVESAIDTNWNSWVIANGEFSLSRGLAGVPNYNNNAGGFLVGADYRLSENFAAGLFAGYEYSYAKYNGGSSTRGNSALFGLYGSYTHEDGYYADAIVSGGYTGFQTRRSIEFSTIDRTASADPNSGQFSAALNLGKDFEIGKFTLGPIIGAQYTYAGIGGFTESGADSLDLALGQQNANSLRTNLGARLAYNWEVGSNITLIPEVRGFWMHEFLNNPRNISSSLDGGSGASFDYETSAPYRNSVFGGVGISAKFADRWSASVFYNVNFGAEGYTNNIISTSLGFSF
jgi:outer membrane autotransporter protein